MEENKDTPTTPITPMDFQSEESSQDAFHLYIPKSKLTYLIIGIALFVLVGIGLYFLREIPRFNNVPHLPPPTIPQIIPSDTVWVEINPTQCLTSPWEKDWLQRNNNFGDYPGQYSPEGVLGVEVKNIITEFYKNKEIDVLDITSLTYEELGKNRAVLCKACSCPQSYVVYLLMSSSDAEKLTREDLYKVSAGPTPASLHIGCTREAKLCPDGTTVGRIPPDCEFEPCPQTQTQDLTHQNLCAFAYTKKSEILSKAGNSATDLECTASSPYYATIYTVTFAWLDVNGNRIPSEGATVMVGEIDGKYTVALPYDHNYCTWLKESPDDEATKYFMGIEQCQ